MTYVKMISEFINSLYSVFVERFFNPYLTLSVVLWSSVAVIVCNVVSSIRKVRINFSVSTGVMPVVFSRAQIFIDILMNTVHDALTK